MDKAKLWLKAPFDKTTQSEIENLLDNSDEINDRFWEELVFYSEFNKKKKRKKFGKN